MIKETISMKEAVARAIYDSLFNEMPPGEYVEENPHSMMAVCLDGYFDLEKLATAAIKAMREPTEAMTEAALSTGSRFGKAAMSNIWQAMIDAALSQE